MTFQKVSLVFFACLVSVISSYRITPLKGTFVLVQPNNFKPKIKDSFPSKKGFHLIPSPPSFIEDPQRHVRHLQHPNTRLQPPIGVQKPLNDLPPQGRPPRRTPVVAQMGKFVQPSKPLPNHIEFQKAPIHPSVVDPSFHGHSHHSQISNKSQSVIQPHQPHSIFTKYIVHPSSFHEQTQQHQQQVTEVFPSHFMTNEIDEIQNPDYSLNTEIQVHPNEDKLGPVKPSNPFLIREPPTISNEIQPKQNLDFNFDNFNSDLKVQAHLNNSKPQKRTKVQVERSILTNNHEVLNENISPSRLELPQNEILKHISNNTQSPKSDLQPDDETLPIEVQIVVEQLPREGLSEVDQKEIKSHPGFLITELTTIDPDLLQKTTSEQDVNHIDTVTVYPDSTFETTFDHDENHFPESDETNSAIFSQESISVDSSDESQLPVPQVLTPTNTSYYENDQTLADPQTSVESPDMMSEDLHEVLKITPKRQTLVSNQQILKGSFNQISTIKPDILDIIPVSDEVTTPEPEKKVYKSRINVFPSVFAPTPVPIFDLGPGNFFLQSPYDVGSVFYPESAPDYDIDGDEQSVSSTSHENETIGVLDERVKIRGPGWNDSHEIKGFTNLNPQEDTIETTTLRSLTTTSRNITTSSRHRNSTTLLPTSPPTTTRLPPASPKLPSYPSFIVTTSPKLPSYPKITVLPHLFPTKSWSYINFNSGINSSSVVNTVVDHQTPGKPVKGIFTTSHSDKGSRPTPTTLIPKTTGPTTKYFVYKHQLHRPIGKILHTTTAGPKISSPILVLDPVLQNVKDDSNEIDNNFQDISNENDGKISDTNDEIRPPIVVENLTKAAISSENEVEMQFPKKHDLQWTPIVNPDITTESSETQGPRPEYKFRPNSNLTLSFKPQSNLGLKKKNPTKKMFIIVKPKPSGYGKNSFEDSDFQSGKPYNFNYRVTSIPNSQYQHEESVDGDGNRSGEYGLQDEHSAIKVSYVVGSKTGFQAQSSYSFSSL